MSRLLAALVVATMASCALSVVALAQRPATRGERAAVLAAAVHQRQVAIKQKRCYAVAISTVDRHWAYVAYAPSSSCRSLFSKDAFEHRTGRAWKLARERWRWVTTSPTEDGVGQVRCPVRGVPRAVLRDFGQISPSCPR